MSRKMVPIVFDNEDLEFISRVLMSWKDEHPQDIYKKAGNKCVDLVEFIKEYLYIYKDRED